MFKKPLKLCMDGVNVEVGPLGGRVVAESVESSAEGKMICFHLPIMRIMFPPAFIMKQRKNCKQMLSHVTLY